MSERAFDPTPPSLGLGATAAAGAVAVGATGLLAPAAPVALGGALLMPLGVWRASRRIHTIGALAAFAGVALAGLAGAHPLQVLLGVAAALLAWDAGEHAIGLGSQVGRRADSRRAMLAHLGASTAVAVAVVAGSYLVFLLARRGQAGAAAVVLAGAAALLALLLDW